MPVKKNIILENEEKFLKRIFEKIEKLTENFTQERSLEIGRGHQPKKTPFVNISKSFPGFIILDPERELNKKLAEKYPQAQGKIVLYLMDHLIEYNIRDFKRKSAD